MNLRWCGLLAALGVAMLATPVTAQVPGARYSPTRPTVSPYLNLLRPDDAILPDYYTFVRPQQQAESFRAQQSLVNRQQQSLLFQQQSEIDLATSGGAFRTRPAQVRSTGTASAFMNYSHFYPSPRAAAKGRR